jgi:GTPase
LHPMKNIVAIIGRPNVGKSTLFNRMLKQQKAIVDDLSGVTRDRHYGTAEWNGRSFTVIDTGGYVPGSDEMFEAAIREQVHIAMEEADLLLFMVDAQEGLTPMDQEIVHLTRRSKKPVLLCANKADNSRLNNDALEFYSMGLGEPFPVSSTNGTGTGELLDKLVELLPEDQTEHERLDIPAIAIVGRPNAGKSSIINALLGEERNIVTPIAGTTRDSIYTRYRAFGNDLYLIDTAGLRKKARAKENVEFYATLRTLRAIDECDVALLIVDATHGIESQELHILGEIVEKSKGVIILVNKWDLVEKETQTSKEWIDLINERIAPLSGVPILFVSALEKTRLLKALELAVEVTKEKEKKVTTSELNEVVQMALAANHPPAVRGRIIRIKYATQVNASIPTFLLFCNHPKLIPESYKRYMEKKIREAFGFKGTPINIFFRDKNKSENAGPGE